MCGGLVGADRRSVAAARVMDTAGLSVVVVSQAAWKLQI
jgi:hypothetical protein